MRNGSQRKKWYERRCFAKTINPGCIPNSKGGRKTWHQPVNFANVYQVSTLATGVGWTLAHQNPHQNPGWRKSLKTLCFVSFLWSSDFSSQGEPFTVSLCCHRMWYGNRLEPPRTTTEPARKSLEPSPNHTVGEKTESQPLCANQGDSEGNCRKRNRKRKSTVPLESQDAPSRSNHLGWSSYHASQLLQYCGALINQTISR